MAAIAQPGAGRRDVVGRRLALRSSSAPACRANPCRPRPARAPGAAAARCSGSTVSATSRSVRRRRDVGAWPASKPSAGTSGARFGGPAGTAWPSRAGQRVGQRIERQPPGERQRGHDLGAGDEVHRRRLTVVAPREVAVVRGDDRVGHRRLLRPRAATGRCTARRRWPAPSPPMSLSDCIWPSRSIVARTCFRSGRHQQRRRGA